MELTAEDLASVPLFADQDPDLLSVFATRFTVDEVRPGKVLTREGAAGYAFYILREGTLTVSHAGVAVRSLGPGDYFGEMSILGDGHRTATVTAETDAVVWVLFGSSFRELEMQAPELAATISQVAAERQATS